MSRGEEEEEEEEGGGRLADCVRLLTSCDTLTSAEQDKRCWLRRWA